MDRDSTVLIIAPLDAAWSALVELLSEPYGYRVLCAATTADAVALARDAHIDLAIADEGSKDFDGCAFLAGLRISSPDVVRVLVLSKASERASKAIREASVYQYLRKPLDVEQAALVVKRGLETRELARRHRLISREFKITEAGSAYAGANDFRPAAKSALRKARLRQRKNGDALRSRENRGEDGFAHPHSRRHGNGQGITSPCHPL